MHSSSRQPARRTVTTFVVLVKHTGIMVRNSAALTSFTPAAYIAAFDGGLGQTKDQHVTANVLHAKSCLSCEKRPFLC